MYSSIVEIVGGNLIYFYSFLIRYLSLIINKYIYKNIIVLFFRYNTTLVPDPSFYNAVIMSACAGFLWQAETPKTGL